MLRRFCTAPKADMHTYLRKQSIKSRCLCQATFQTRRFVFVSFYVNKKEKKKTERERVKE